MPGALELVTGVKAALQASLGAEHPVTLVAANNLACYLRCIDRLPEALALIDETLGRMQRNLGESHPLTLSCAVNLANCRGDAGDLAAAEKLERQTITLLRRPSAGITRTRWSARPIWPPPSRQRGHHRRPRSSGRGDGRLQPRAGRRHPDAAQLQDWQRINRDLEPQVI